MKKVIARIYKALIRAHLAHPVVLVNMDGGICSQMQQYLMGRLLQQRGCHVQFDLSFYAYGRDLDGRQVRNFDLLKIFPWLPFDAAPRWKRSLYRRCFRHNGHYPQTTSADWLSRRAPVFLGGYYPDVREMYASYATLFHPVPDVLDEANRTLYDAIPDHSVAVHVRRGDLSAYNEAYGQPASLDYFVEAVRLLRERLGRHTRFYLFSDDMDYVQTQLVPLLPRGLDLHLVDNDAAHGYFDLLLMSRCRHHITSKGSLAKFAACMNMSQGIAIVVQDDRQLGPLAYSDKEIIRL